MKNNIPSEKEDLLFPCPPSLTHKSSVSEIFIFKKERIIENKFYESVEDRILS